MEKTQRLFHGLTEDAYQFFWDIAFHNEKQYFEENRTRYYTSVKWPLEALAADLLPYAEQINPAFSKKPHQILSRIRRDTRYTKDKSPYRDHAWLGFRPEGKSTGESCVLYAEFERTSYGYGMGIWHSNTELMQRFRERMLAEPKRFLTLIEDAHLREHFELTGESFSRCKYTEGSQALRPYLNMRSISLCYSSSTVSKTFSPDITDEILEGFALLAPLYRFLMGLE